MIKKIIFNLIIASSFFFWGIFTVHDKMFPYRILKQVKDSINVISSTIIESPSNKNDQQPLLSQQQYPNFNDKKRNLIKYSKKKIFMLIEFIIITKMIKSL